MSRRLHHNSFPRTRHTHHETHLREVCCFSWVAVGFVYITKTKQSHRWVMGVLHGGSFFQFQTFQCFPFKKIDICGFNDLGYLKTDADSGKLSEQRTAGILERLEPTSEQATNLLTKHPTRIIRANDRRPTMAIFAASNSILLRVHERLTKFSTEESRFYSPKRI